VLSLSDLRFRFDAIRREERRALLSIGGSRALMASVAFILLYFLFDRFFAPPLAGRWGALILGLAGVGWLIKTGILAHWGRVSSDDEIAQRLEDRHPELHGRLLSFVQLARSRDEDRLLGSPVLMQALEQETLAAVARLDFRAIVPRDLARVSILAASFALVVQVTCFLLLPQHFAALAVRLVEPGRAFPTRTRIERIEVPGWIASGSEVPVVVRLERESVLPEGSGTLLFRERVEGTETRIALEQDPEGPHVFRGVLSQAVADLDVVVHVGDARSTPRRIRVVPRPEVKSGTIRYRWPGYLASMDPVEQDLGALDVVQAGTVELEIESTAPLADARLVERFGESWPLMPVAGDGLRWRLRDPFPVTRHTGIHVWMRDRHGITNAVPAVEYPIAVRMDQPPEIVLKYPARDLSVTPRARLGLRFEMRDDFGVRSAWLVYQVEREGKKKPKAQRISLTQLVRDAEGQFLPEQQFIWFLPRLGLEPGDQVVFWLEADDGCPTNNMPPVKDGEPPAKGPVHSRSSQIRLTVVSEEQKTLELQTRISRLYEELNSLREDQDGLSDRVRDLLRRLGQPVEEGR